jgi:dTDP-4-amino-4,6-dideoxygalactose transaminase
MIPLCDVSQQYLALKEEIDAAMQQVAADGRYILGPNVKAFEGEMAAYCQARFAVGVGNGTDALQLALRALDIGPGDEVITTPFTFIATAEAISLVGARPVFVDINPRTFNIDPGQVEAAVTARTKAILPVHLYGQPCDMAPLLAVAEHYGLYVVEDCAQAIGAAWRGRKVGTLGHVGCFSFFPSKNLGAMGDGGMVITNDARLYERVEVLRRHGGRVKYYHEELGTNSRLDELHAAVLRIKLRRLDEWNTLRRRHAYRYNALLATCPGLERPAEQSPYGATVPDSEQATVASFYSVYHQYTLVTDERDAVVEALAAQGIGCMIYYPVPLHLQKVYAGLGYGVGSFPHAERAAKRCFSIPMFPELTLAQQEQVAICLNSKLAELAGRRQAA